MPIPVIGHLPQHEFARAKRVHGLQTYGGNHGTDKGVPHYFVGEVVGDLFEGEEDAAYGGAKCDGHACCGSGREDLAFFGYTKISVWLMGEDEAGGGEGG